MNKIQRRILLVGSAIIGLVILFPPRSYTYQGVYDRKPTVRFSGYRFVLDPYHYDEPIAIGQLFGQITAVVVLSGLLALAYKEPKEK